MKLPLDIRHITTKAELTPYRTGLTDLLGLYREQLLPDPNLSKSEALQTLYENTASCIPLLWLIEDARQQVFAAAVLMDITPGQQAVIHGASHPAMRRHPIITELALHLFETGFAQYGLQTIRAEFPADNRDALGFCRRMGFQRIDPNTPPDGTIRYQLTRTRFETRFPNPTTTQRSLHHAHWR